MHYIPEDKKTKYREKNICKTNRFSAGQIKPNSMR
jgi:hypothetical protein